MVWKNITWKKIREWCILRNLFSTFNSFFTLTLAYTKKYILRWMWFEARKIWSKKNICQEYLLLFRNLAVHIFKINWGVFNSQEINSFYFCPELRPVYLYTSEQCLHKFFLTNCSLRIKLMQNYSLAQWNIYAIQ